MEYEFEKFDKKYPEFERAVGIKFSQMSADTQTMLLAEWVKAGQWERVQAGQEFIKPFMRVDALSGNSFHEWLLTNPEERAFDLWKSIRNREQQTGTYRAEQWGDSAALILYANFPERLSALGLKEWSKSINVVELKTRGIEFHSVAEVSDKIKSDVEDAWFKSDRKTEATPMDCACYHGSEVSIKASLEVFKTTVAQVHFLPTTWRKSNLFEAFKWYMRLGDEAPLSTLTDALHTTNAWSVSEDRSSYGVNTEGEKNLLKTAFLRFGLNRVQDFWKSAPDEAKDDLFSSARKWVDFKRQLLKKERLSHLNLAQTLEVAYTNKLDKTMKDVPNFTLGDLWESIKNGNASGAYWLLERHPEWLEEKDWVYENRSGSSAKGRADAGSKKGTPLVLAAVHGHQELVEGLLAKGASPAPLKDIMDYAPFKKSEHYKRFASIAERVRLRQKVTKKADIRSNDSTPGLAL